MQESLLAKGGQGRDLISSWSVFLSEKSPQATNNRQLVWLFGGWGLPKHQSLQSVDGSKLRIINTVGRLDWKGPVEPLWALM